MGRVIEAFAQFFDGEGYPLVNGWLRFLVSSSNNTDKDTFNDPLYQIANANPLQLDAEGRCPNVFGVGDYRVISYVNDPEDEDSPGEQVQMFDPVTAQGSVEITGGSGTVFDSWSITVTYDLGDIVVRDLGYYRSLINSNLGLDPLLQEYAWEHIDFLPYYNSTIFYSIGDPVFYNDNIWFSLQDANQNHTPNTSPAYWQPASVGYKGWNNRIADYSMVSGDIGKIIVYTPEGIPETSVTWVLPPMDSTTDRARIAVYNPTSYEVNLSAAGDAKIWNIDGTTLPLGQGCCFELIYSSYLNTWLPLANMGPVLGSQDIGTVTDPVSDLYATDVTATTYTALESVTAPIVNASYIYLASDGPFYLGDANEVTLAFLSATSIFDINVATGVSLNYSINDVDMWTISSDGDIFPAATNPSPDLGSATNSLNFIYTDNISLPTSGYAYFGDTDELVIGCTGTINLFASSITTTFRNTTLAPITFELNSTEILSIGHSFFGTYFIYSHYNLYFDQENAFIYFGPSASLNLAIGHTGTAAYLNSYDGDLVFQRNSTTKLVCSSTYVGIYDDLKMLAGDQLYWDTGQLRIFFDDAFNIGRVFTTGTTPLVFGVNSASNWFVNVATGAFLPWTTETYDLGAPTFLVNNLYTAGIYGDGTPMRFGLSTAWRVELTNIYEVEVVPGTWQIRFVVTTPNGTGRTYEISGS